jgi:D-tyrosyl-tRNA(Tyr) deacylase
MRAVIQRVASASVTVDGEVVGRIGKGLLVFAGIGRADEPDHAAGWVQKVVGLRIFENDLGKMDRTVLDVAGALLIVSQFTLYGDLRRGRRPSFDEAMPPEAAEPIYERLLAEARRIVPTQAGRFRAHMLVESVNDGPVTLCLDTAKTSATPSG